MGLVLLMLVSALPAFDHFQKMINPELRKSALPTFAMKNINKNSGSFGDTLTLEQYKGQVLLVYFGSLG